MENTGSANRIRSYDVGTITVNESVYNNTLIVSRDMLVTDWEPASVDQITAEHMQRLLAMKPEVVIIGSGSRVRFPERSLLAQAIRAGIGIEVMTTPAACRTYNVLMAEDRQAAVALFMMENAFSG